jgi:hypothetical protein
LVSGIKLIIPIVTGMVLNTSDINGFQFVMNIFMLVGTALMFASFGLICQWHTKKGLGSKSLAGIISIYQVLVYEPMISNPARGLCCNCCCDYEGEEAKEVEPTQMEKIICQITPVKPFLQPPPPYPAEISQNFPDSPTPQNVPTAIATAVYIIIV